MRIAAITAHDDGRRYSVTLPTVRGPLTAIYGPAQSGKSSIADLVGHALFGKRPTVTPGSVPPDGELIVEDRGNRYRVRRCQDDHGPVRLMVAAIGGRPAEQHTIRS